MSQSWEADGINAQCIFWDATKSNAKEESEEKGCVDVNEKNCRAWADSGECSNNPAYMNEHCCKSCGNEIKECVDINEKDCKAWADSGECSKNPTYMNENCCKSCRNEIFSQLLM